MTMPYLFPEDEQPNTELTPSVPSTETSTETSGDYLFGEQVESAPAPTPQPRFQHTPPVQDSPQIFPTGQDHVAREVLGLKPKPYQRSEILPESHFGILGDIGSGIADSFLRAGSMTLEAVRAYDPPGGLDAVRDVTTAGIEKIKGWEDEYPRIFKQSQEGQDSYFRRSVYSALVNFTPSAYSGLVGGAAGAAAGSLIGGPVGTAIGFILGFGGGAGLLFGSAEYDNFMEEADANGIPRDQVFGEALTSAFVEGGGEMVADVISLAAFGPTGGLSIASKGALKQMMRVPIKKLVKTYLKTAPVEVITEMIQGSSQVALRNKAGMDAGTPWNAAVEAIGPALIMTALFGVTGGAKQSLHLRQMRKALENGAVDPAKRQAAADFIETQIKDKDFAELWKFNAKQFIDAGYDMPIDRPMAEFLSWGESSKYSPEMAQGLMEGKDIKLLPEPERGFVLVGDSLNPDEREEYDEYSPEQAEALLNAKNTELLPDGQGFTVGTGGAQYTVYSTKLAKELKVAKEKKLLGVPDRRAEAPHAPPVIPIPPVEAAARGVESAIETGTEEDMAQAQRRLERRVEAEKVVPNKTLSLVRSVLKATPGATIGEVYRSVKTSNPEASRQEVANLYRRETRTELPSTQKDLAIALNDLGQEEFNHQYNPLNMEAKLIKQLVDQGVSRENAKAEVRPVIEKYSANYKKVNDKALAQRAKEKKAAEAVKKAAEDVKKLKAKPKPKKAELKAPDKKKAAQPLVRRTKEQVEAAKQGLLDELDQEEREEKATLKKATAAESVAAMGKEPKLRAKPKGKASVTGVFYRTKKEATQVLRTRHDGAELTVEERADKEWIVVRKPLVHGKKRATVTPIRKKGTTEAKEDEIKPSKLRIGAKVATEEGAGEIIGSPQPDQWEVRMSEGWGKGDTLLFSTKELDSKPTGKVSETQVAYDRAQKEIEKIEAGKPESIMGRVKKAPRLIALGIAKTFKKQGFIDLRGTKVANASDMAEVAQIFRNKLFETIRFIYVKDGQIVGHEGISSGMPGFSSLAVKSRARDLQGMRDRKKRLGADGYYIIHNHPSGNPVPSQQDVNATLDFWSKYKDKDGKAVPGLDGFLGHVIINHETFVAMTPTSPEYTHHNIQRLKLDDGDVLHIHKARLEKYGKGEEDPLLQAYMPHFALGREMMSPEKAAAIGALESEDGYMTLMYIAGDSLRAIQNVPKEMFNKATDSHGRLHISNYILGRMKEFGAANVVTYLSGKSTIDQREVLRTLLGNFTLLDAIYYKDEGGNFSSLADSPTVAIERETNARVSEESRASMVAGRLFSSARRVHDQGAKAKFGDRPTLTAKEREREEWVDGPTITYDLNRGDELAGTVVLDLNHKTGEVYVDWFEHDDKKWGQMGMLELRKIMKQFKKDNPDIKRYVGFRAYDDDKKGTPRAAVDVRAKLGEEEKKSKAKRGRLYHTAQKVHDRGAKSYNKLLSDILGATKENGGATFNMVTGKNLKGTNNYAIGVFPGQTVEIKEELTGDVLNKFTNDNAEKLRTKGFNLGTWVAPDGTTHLDISVAKPELWKSIALAKEFGQEYIFDLREEIDEELFTKSDKKGKVKSLAEVVKYIEELDNDEPIHLVRYMKKNVTTHKGTTVGSIDPSEGSHRTDMPGVERDRLEGDLETPNRVHYYEKGGAVEPDVAKLPHVYETSIPRSKLYDTIADPLNLRVTARQEGQAKADPNMVERKMRDAGYWGYQNPGGPFPSTVVVFEQLPVYEISDVKASLGMARSAASVAKQAKAERDLSFIRVIRKAIPTAKNISPVENQGDVYTATMPNGAKIEFRFNDMPDITPEQLEKFREAIVGSVEDAENKVPIALWVADKNVTITGSGVIWMSGLGDTQSSAFHEVYHAAKSIVTSAEEDAQLRKDYPAKDERTGEEIEALAYEKWKSTTESHAIFDKIRSFFLQIAETFGLSKGKSYKIFRMISEGKAWERPIGKVSNRGRLYDAIVSLQKEVPRYKGGISKGVKGQATIEDIKNDRDHWETVGAVLYIEGLSGKEWNAEMTAHLKEHYLLDTLPRGILKIIREDSKHIFKKRATETLTGKLPTMEALLEMEQRGAKEGGIVWYDARDGLSMLVKGEDGEIVARSARSELEEYFGEDAEFMAGLIAHLSSGMQVPVNTIKAIEVYIAHKLDIGFKGTYQVTRDQIDEFIRTRETSGPKRLPFFDAIMGDADAIVIDRWMARVLNFRTWDKKTQAWVTSTGASDDQRELLIEWVKRGAKRLGISNRAYQAMIWAGKKAIDEEISGRKTGSLRPLAEVIEQKVKLKGILAKDIPEGEESEYFILKGMDRWAIHLDSFMPLADLLLFEKIPVTRKPKAISVPKLPKDVITTAEREELDAQQVKMFARMGPRQTETTIVEDSLDDIFGQKHKGVLQKMKDGIGRLKEWRTLILDEFHPILKHLGEKTYKTHRMLNGTHASIEAMMRHGKLKLDDEGHIVADGVNRGFAVWAKKHGQDAVNVLRWAAAERSKELERDNPEWLKNEEFLTEAKREVIYREIGEAPEGGGTWESLHAEFDEFHQSVLDIAEKAGLIDAVVREDWRDLIYVPFYRVFEDTSTREEFLANPRKAKDIAAKVKPIKGSKRKIGEPIENVIANWGYMIQESMRNQARAEAYANAKMLNEVGDLMRDIDYQEIKHTIINDKGVISYETERGDDMVLSFLDNGKRKYFSVHDADLYYALTTMNAQHFGKLFNAFFGGPKRLLTYGATFGPAFRVANAVRDTLHTWMITPGASFKPFLDTFKGFISSMREDEHYVAALAAGGLHGGSYVHAEDPASMSKFTRRLLGRDKDSILLDTGAKILEFWDRLGAASENAARVQLHRNLVEKGESGFEAAYQARDLLDFSLKGQASIVLALIRTVPFLGARTQGNYRLARSFHKGNRLSMSIKGGILAAASLALWAAFKDDDRYKELEDYDKWTYYHFWIGDQHFRMPKPFEVGAIFSSAFESAANTMTDNEEIEFMARFFKHTFTETFAVGVPQTIKPLAELWANKSFFTGRPIEGRAMKLLQPGERAEPWTSETLQLLGRGLNISPKKMEALSRGYLATISSFFLGGTDQIARWVGDFPERPTYTSSDYPLVGRFWRQGIARNTKYATRLYEAMEESDRLVQTVKHYKITGDMEKARRLARSNLGLFRANKMLNRIRKRMTDVRRAMKSVERDRTINRDEKRRKIDELTLIRNGLTKRVYDILQTRTK